MTPAWRKALQARRAARLLLENGVFDDATSRAYYAMFEAARAAMRERFDVRSEVTKRHATTIALFSLHFVKSGLVDRAHGVAFSTAFAARSDADYGDASVSQATATAVVTSMDAFLEALADLMNWTRE